MCRQFGLALGSSCSVCLATALVYKLLRVDAFGLVYGCSAHGLLCSCVWYAICYGQALWRRQQLPCSRGFGWDTLRRFLLSSGGTKQRYPNGPPCNQVPHRTCFAWVFPRANLALCTEHKKNGAEHQKTAHSAARAVPFLACPAFNLDVFRCALAPPNKKRWFLAVRGFLGSRSQKPFDAFEQQSFHRQPGRVLCT